MSLATNVQEQIRRYVVGLVSADDLSDWLSVHAQQVLDSGNSELRQLMDLTFNLLEDEGNGFRTEDEAREILGREVFAAVGLHRSIVGDFSMSARAGTISTIQHQVEFETAWAPTPTVHIHASASSAS